MENPLAPAPLRRFGNTSSSVSFSKLFLFLQVSISVANYNVRMQQEPPNYFPYAHINYINPKYKELPRM
ncbi:hypothetical protein L2E82_39119 [Cichorium intybus]|uniref:Uncharacterized protein n=1 Tax=Cichorium intybus TaxID=13427 RepID=A0ACB9AIA7_CICIN|nr:hypothetical protein L2E82_39119 [Cichorium intybus]